MTTEYRKSSLNIVPNALSRMYEDEAPALSAISYSKRELEDWYLSKIKAVRKNSKRNGR